MELPRHVRPKRLASGATAFYYDVPQRYRAIKCPVPNEPLGTDYAAACEKAKTLNGLFDEWDQQRKGLPISTPMAPKIGTVDWLFREYKVSLAYTKKVAMRSRGDYEKSMALLCDTLTKVGDRVGSRAIRSISPNGADKLYAKIVINKDGERRDRTAEKVVILCRKAWRVVHRLHPEYFDKAMPNPWTGVTMETRTKAKKPAVTREQVYTFARGCIEHGEVQAAAVAVICFEWLQRPENIIGGHITWNDYRSKAAPTIIRVAHHKTGTVAPHPLEEKQPDGSVVKFYADAEEILSRLPRLGVPMILLKKKRNPDKGRAVPYAFVTMQHIVQVMRKKLGLPDYFTHDACRHGGMTELEEAELTDGQGRALSTHKTQQSYEGYAKRTEKRMLSATRKRHAHRLAETAALEAAKNEPETSVRNETADSVRNEKRPFTASG
ncbi:MAG: hypothetical protein Q8M24_18550 [Pseudolabrys sp.]|nr:hypothetical protein [Pseudolabrys sp.]MDP2297447.1 hypothetical protein [Pseudolabrys sp.]